MSGTAIRLERCGKTFADGTRALDPVDLEFTAGETVVLLGPSGCGKTTTLRIVAGLELPDAGGRVLFDGADVTAVPIERRNVGMVFQSYALVPQHVGRGERRLRPQGARHAGGGTRPACARDAGDDADRRLWRPAASISCPVASGSGWRWRARLHHARVCCCSTSP